MLIRFFSRIDIFHFLFLNSDSNIGSDDHRTRQGYKTGQIRQACSLMEEMAANLNVHQLVIDRAKEEYVHPQPTATMIATISSFIQ